MLLVQLKYAIAVAKYKNYSHAAEELFITQPALSQQIMRLEEELNCRLFIRSPRKIELTKAGEMFVQGAQKVLDDLAELENSMQVFWDGKQGVIGVGVPSHAEELGIFCALEKFLPLHPQVSLSYSINYGAGIIKLLEDRKIDIGFILAPANFQFDKKFEVFQMEKANLSVVIRRDSNLSTQSKISVKDLKDRTCILPNANSFLNRELKKLFATTNVNFHLIGEVATETAIQLASHQDCVMFTAQPIYNERLVSIPFTPTISRSVYMVALKDALTNKPVKDLFAHVKSQYCEPSPS